MFNSNHPLVKGVAFLYELLVRITNHLQSPFLLLIRVVFGIQLIQSGWGKLMNIQKPIDYFTTLGIPLPVENAWLVSFTELFGGTLLALGLLSRLTMVPLTINFIVAYITTEQQGLKDLLKFDTDAFVADAAFPFLATVVIVLAFGPGVLSLDYLIARWRGLEWKSARF